MNTAHRWTSQESYDAWHKPEYVFFAKYPDINKDALRLKLRRDSRGNEYTAAMRKHAPTFWDIETTGLDAKYDRVMCYAVKTDIHTDTLATPESDERWLLRALRDVLESARIIVGWNSKGFDLPFMNERLRQYGERLCEPLTHLDAMMYIPNGLPRSLKVITGTSGQRELWDHNNRLWNAAGRFEPEAITEVMRINAEHVRLTELAFRKWTSNDQ